jgi:hypothetical protein
MTMIRPAMTPALRPVARAAKAAVMPERTPAPVAPVRAVKAQGAVETGGKVIGGLVGGVAGVMGGSAVGLLLSGLLGTAALPICALGFGAIGAWGGANNGGGIGQIIEGFFK